MELNGQWPVNDIKDGVDQYHGSRTGSQQCGWSWLALIDIANDLCWSSTVQPSNLVGPGLGLTVLTLDMVPMGEWNVIKGAS